MSALGKRFPPRTAEVYVGARALGEDTARSPGPSPEATGTGSAPPSTLTAHLPRTGAPWGHKGTPITDPMHDVRAEDQPLRRAETPTRAPRPRVQAVGEYGRVASRASPDVKRVGTTVHVRAGPPARTRTNWTPRCTARTAFRLHPPGGTCAGHRGRVRPPAAAACASRREQESDGHCAGKQDCQERHQSSRGKTNQRVSARAQARAIHRPLSQHQSFPAVGAANAQDRSNARGTAPGSACGLRAPPRGPECTPTGGRMQDELGPPGVRSDSSHQTLSPK